MIRRGWRPGEGVPGVMRGGVVVLTVHRAGLRSLMQQIQAHRETAAGARHRQ
jgi:hypothetical protein